MSAVFPVKTRAILPKHIGFLCVQMYGWVCVQVHVLGQRTTALFPTPLRRGLSLNLKLGRWSNFQQLLISALAWHMVLCLVFCLFVSMRARELN